MRGRVLQEWCQHLHCCTQEQRRPVRERGAGVVDGGKTRRMRGRKPTSSMLYMFPHFDFGYSVSRQPLQADSPLIDQDTMVI